MNEERLTKEEWFKWCFEDNNTCTLFGLPFSGVRKILYEYETKGIHPENRIKEIIEMQKLQKEIERLKEIEWIYLDLCQ